MSNNPRTVMAFDYGLRNIGVAVGNLALATCQPQGIIRARDGTPDWQAVAAILKEWQPDVLLVGHPLNMDGTESDMSARASRFARQLNGRFGLPVTLVDERLSSREAKERVREQGHSGNFDAEPVDDEAAAVILGSWLRDQRS